MRRTRGQTGETAGKMLDFLTDEIARTGIAPSIRDIGRRLGLRSPRTVQRHLESLEAEGHITRATNSRRTIQLVNPSPGGLRLLGMIPAGTPIEAVETADHFDLAIQYPADRHFLLRVTGDSMIDDHIADGDLVVVRQQQTCSNGAIAVVRLDGDDVTLKRFYKEKRRIRLQPANPTLRPIYRQDVEVIGVVVGVLRTMV